MRKIVRRIVVVAAAWIFLSVPTWMAASEQQRAESTLRGNRHSNLTRADFRKRIEPRLQSPEGLTEQQLQQTLGTRPVLTGNGELLWVLADGFVLTASLEGKDASMIVCWTVKSDR